MENQNQKNNETTTAVGKFEAMLGDMNKASVKEFAGVQAAKILNDGNSDIPDVYARIVKMQEFLKTLQDEIKSDAMAEIEKAGDEGISKFGVQMKWQKGSQYRDYDADPEVAKLKEKLAKRKALLKKVVDLEGVALIDEDTGEQIEPPPLGSIGADSIRTKW